MTNENKIDDLVRTFRTLDKADQEFTIKLLIEISNNGKNLQRVRR